MTADIAIVTSGSKKDCKMIASVGSENFRNEADIWNNNTTFINKRPESQKIWTVLTSNGISINDISSKLMKTR